MIRSLFKRVGLITILPTLLVVAIFGAAPTMAAGATTVTLHPDSISDSAPFTCAGPFTGTFAFSVSGNVVEHLTTTDNGSTTTGTAEGDMTVVMTPGGTFKGHGQAWDSNEVHSAGGSVQHATLNAELVNTATGAPLHVHANFALTMNPAGSVTDSHFDVNCT